MSRTDTETGTFEDVIIVLNNTVVVLILYVFECPRKFIENHISLMSRQILHHLVKSVKQTKTVLINYMLVLSIFFSLKIVVSVNVASLRIIIAPFHNLSREMWATF